MFSGAGVNISGQCFAPSGRKISRRWSRSTSSRTPSTGPSSSSSTQTLWTSRPRTPSVSTHFNGHQPLEFLSSVWLYWHCACLRWLQACWTWPPLTAKTASNACVSRSSRGESPWKTPLPCCPPPYDTTQRCGIHKCNAHPGTVICYGVIARDCWPSGASAPVFLLGPTSVFLQWHHIVQLLIINYIICFPCRTWRSFVSGFAWTIWLRWPRPEPSGRWREGCSRSSSAELAAAAPSRTER